MATPTAFLGWLISAAFVVALLVAVYVVATSYQTPTYARVRGVYEVPQYPEVDSGIYTTPSYRINDGMNRFNNGYIWRNRTNRYVRTA